MTFGLRFIQNAGYPSIMAYLTLEVVASLETRLRRAAPSVFAEETGTSSADVVTLRSCWLRKCYVARIVALKV